MSTARLFAWTVLAVVAGGLLAPIADILGFQVAGMIWSAAGLTAPWLWQAGIICGGAVAGALIGLLQWTTLPRVRARWISISTAAGVGIAVVYLIYKPSTVLVAPVAAALAAIDQGRLLPHAGQRWVRAQTLAAAWVALGLLLPFPRWAAACLIVAAAVLSTWGIRSAWNAPSPGVAPVPPQPP